MNIKVDRKPLSAEQLSLMKKLNIRHSLVDAFHYREYRYSNIDDAVAQATRKENK
jgi:hypothetical protein